MKKIYYSIISGVLIFLGAACQKDTDQIRATSNVNVINAAVGLGAIKVNAGAGTGFSYAAATNLAYSTNNIYGAFVGSNTIKVVNATDTTNSLFNRTVNLQAANTLYIAGQSPSIDTIFRVEKNLPYINGAALQVADSSMHVRFVNLSPNSTPLNITIKSATTNEVTGLAYKGITDFKKYVATPSTANYIFEVRDVATNTLQTSFTLSPNNNRFRTIALVIRGLMGTTTGVAPFGIFQVNYK